MGQGETIPDEKLAVTIRPREGGPLCMFSVQVPVGCVRALIAETENGRTVGESYYAFASMPSASGDSLPLIYLLWRHVIPRMRLKGIGTRMLEAVEQIGIESGCRGLILAITAENTHARAWYQRRGYRILGERRNDYRSIVFSMQQVLPGQLEAVRRQCQFRPQPVETLLFRDFAPPARDAAASDAARQDRA